MHTTVPAYLKNADVLVVPHVVTGFTDSLDPIKVYEYLAAGLPVVSTPVAGFREIGLAHVSVVPGEPFPRGDPRVTDLAAASSRSEPGRALLDRPCRRDARRHGRGSPTVIVGSGMAMRPHSHNL